MYTLAVQSLRAERRLVDDDVTAYSNTVFFCQRAGGDHISHVKSHVFFMVNLGACTIHGSSGYISKVAPGPLKNMLAIFVLVVSRISTKSQPHSID